MRLHVATRIIRVGQRQPFISQALAAETVPVPRQIFKSEDPYLTGVCPPLHILVAFRGVDVCALPLEVPAVFALEDTPLFAGNALASATLSTPTVAHAPVPIRIR